MYSKELEAIIEAALADGVLTDKEREVLHRRAAQEGVDTDELDVIIDGKLAKMKQEKDWLRPDPPTTEKRGNVVKCPNCGTPIQAGTAKCTECGYVFTNVQANTTAREFAKELDVRISKANSDTARSKVKEFIKNYPLPSGKEDLIEFIASMDARRRSRSTYQKAYDTKYKEAVNKAKIQFIGDSQMEELIKQTNRFSLSLLPLTPILIGIGALALILLLIFVNNSNAKTAQLAEVQCDSLCKLLDDLETPDINNYKQVESQLLKITWKDIPGDETNYKRTYLQKKRALAEQIGSVHTGNYNDWAGSDTYEYNGAPDPISHPSMYIDN